MNRFEYDQINAINWSSLKWMADSPAKYYHMLTHKQPETEAMRFGRAVHMLVFEPALFSAECAIFDGPRRAGREWKAFSADNEGKTIYKASEIAEAEAIAEAVRYHPLVVPYLRVEDGRFEEAIVWTDTATGLRCKAIPDWYIPSAHILIDLKTTTSIDGRRFGYDAAKYRYHCQMAHYANGLERNGTPPRVLLIAVEKLAPYDVGVFDIPPDDLWIGTDEVGRLLNLVSECRESGRWPGRYTEEQALQLPAWVSMDDDDSPESFGLTIGE